ncbi:MAG: hypothetical protein V1897_01990 [Pseudomonadota bacterium]
MEQNTIIPEENCGSFVSDGVIGPEACLGCNQKMELTFEEQGILDHLRSIKQKARTAIAVIKDIEQRRFNQNMSDSVFIENEWLRLSRELEDLRLRWAEWSRRLDDATERKWIMLGHRKPKASL